MSLSSNEVNAFTYSHLHFHFNVIWLTNRVSLVSSGEIEGWYSSGEIPLINVKTEMLCYIISGSVSDDWYKSFCFCSEKQDTDDTLSQRNWHFLSLYLWQDIAASGMWSDIQSWRPSSVQMKIWSMGGSDSRWGLQKLTLTWVADQSSKYQLVKYRRTFFRGKVVADTNFKVRSSAQVSCLLTDIPSNWVMQPFLDKTIVSHENFAVNNWMKYFYFHSIFLISSNISEIIAPNFSSLLAGTNAATIFWVVSCRGSEWASNDLHGTFPARGKNIPGSILSRNILGHGIPWPKIF